MSAVIELEDKKAEVSSNGNDGGAIRPYLFTIEIYDEMIRKGILTENDNVELLNGRIIKKIPKGTKHTSVNTLITRYFTKI